jgi:hypothetical protein
MMIQSRGPAKPSASGSRRKNWHAVAVVSKSGGCEAARAIRHLRFLSAEAPRLPLADCATPEGCSCAYKHFDDRRVQTRRKEDLDGMRRGVQGRTERRARGDRRGGD